MHRKPKPQTLSPKSLHPKPPCRDLKPDNVLLTNEDRSSRPRGGGKERVRRGDAGGLRKGSFGLRVLSSDLAFLQSYMGCRRLVTACVLLQCPFGGSHRRLGGHLSNLCPVQDSKKVLTDVLAHAGVPV